MCCLVVPRDDDVKSLVFRHFQRFAGRTHRHDDDEARGEPRTYVVPLTFLQFSARVKISHLSAKNLDTPIRKAILSMGIGLPSLVARSAERLVLRG